MARASNADADQYAPAELAQAGSALSAAQAAMASRRDDEARALSARAAALADLAYARSREAAAQNELTQRRAEIADLRQRLRLED